MIRSIKYLILFSCLLLIFLVFHKSLKTDDLKFSNNIKEIELINVSFEEFVKNNSIQLKEVLSERNFNLINIWASWCKPCVQEHPELMDLKKSTKIKIIGINYKDRTNNAKNFLSKLGNPYHSILSDITGTNVINLGAIGVPETFLVNKDFIIIKKFIGPLDDKKVREIKELIK